ncbi:MAG: FAD-binding oxidoreductase [Gammaproteobacteria bacterium]|nr:FAD-binding oxidoreductase [Gammaproteobacteria bacterium]
MPASIFTDDFKPQPYWWDDTPQPVSILQSLPKKVDVLVVGSGYTGLNCAIQTARGGRDTLVIDSQSLGWGCSARNGGQISGEIKPGYAQLKRKYGEDKAFALTQEARIALDWVQQFIHEEQIDCDLRPCGRFNAAHSPRQFRRLVEYAENQPSGLEQDLIIVDRQHQASEIDSDFYHGGLVIPAHSSLDPAKYHQGLYQRAIDSGCNAIGDCEALHIERQHKGFIVTTSIGKLEARNIVIATSGYTGPVSPWQRRRLIPIGSYMLATEELDAALVQQLLPQDRVFSDTRKLVVYFRRSPDSKQILFGGRVSVFESDPVKSASALRQEMLRILPQLSTARLSHAWMGFVGFSFDYLPHLGEQDGIYYAMGYCGSGICLASYFGNRLGRQLLGDAEARIAFNDVDFPTRPFYNGRPWFLAAAVQYYQLRDRFI